MTTIIPTLAELIRSRLPELGLSQHALGRMIGSISSARQICCENQNVSGSMLLKLLSACEVRKREDVQSWLAAFLCEKIGPMDAVRLMTRAGWEFPETPLAHRETVLNVSEPASPPLQLSRTPERADRLLSVLRAAWDKRQEGLLSQEARSIIRDSNSIVRSTLRILTGKGLLEERRFTGLDTGGRQKAHMRRCTAWFITEAGCTALQAAGVAA